jgi:hypothetical protein
MKKLAVVVMMIAIATFMAAPMASADDHHRWGIHGKYAVTGANGCLAAPFGFDSSLTAIDGVSGFGFQTWEGTYTFERNGTGLMQVLFHDVGATPNAGGSGNIEWRFAYTVTDERNITFTIDGSTYSGQWLTGPMAPGTVLFTVTGSYSGVISPDGKQIFVTWGAPLMQINAGAQPPIPNAHLELICNGSFVLFRLGDARD